MSRDLPNGSYSWNLLDPDPGTFTNLCSAVGVQGVQVEKIDLVNPALFHTLRPVYGFMILVRHHSDYVISKNDSFNSHNDYNIYFNHQVIPDAYAMHGLLNVILNHDTLEIGPDLSHFKKLTSTFTSALKGLTLTNSRSIREAYNRLGSPRTRPCKYMYHPISYIQHSGFIWELDCLRKSPTRLGACNEHNWLDVMYMELTKKNAMLQKQNLLVSIWTVIENRKMVYQRKLMGKTYIKKEIESRLDEYNPDWRMKLTVKRWEEEYMHVMNNERNKRGLGLSKCLSSYYYSLEQLSLNEQSTYRNQLHEYIKHNGMMDAWLQVQDDTLRLYECLGEEDDKDQVAEIKSKQKKPNYIPFIRSFIHGLLEEGHLKFISDES